MRRLLILVCLWGYADPLLCHVVLPPGTAIVPDLFMASSVERKNSDCMEISMAADTITFYDTRQHTTMILSHDTLEVINDKTLEHKTQKRHTIGQYAQWIDVVERLLWGGSVHRGQCTTRQGIRRCHMRLDALQELIIMQRQMPGQTRPMEDVWVTRLHTTDQDTTTLWWKERGRAR